MASCGDELLGALEAGGQVRRLRLSDHRLQFDEVLLLFLLDVLRQSFPEILDGRQEGGIAGVQLLEFIELFLGLLLVRREYIQN